VLLVPAYAVVVTAPSGPDQSCPTPRQITDALMARIPAVVMPSYEASTPGVLRLAVSGGSGATPLRIDLTDQGGEARLHRNLTLAERSRGGDCAALADTVALIVERFLHDLGYEAPPLPTPSILRANDNLSRGPPMGSPKRGNRVDVFAGGLWRGAPGQDGDYEAALGFGYERGIGPRRLQLTLSGGVSTTRSGRRVDNSNATLRRIPLRVGLFLPLSVGPGWIEPGIRLGIDWLFTSLNSARRRSPAGELVVGYRIQLVDRLFVRISASGGVGVPYQYLTTPAGDPESRQVFDEPRFYAKCGLELGFSFQ
jgi:hypothetical protein